ncbi:unnamed protein product [Mytilus coruscus]|uniref:Uncharacterized protein n=1 Tax=Mytilus coruscus TaxID=42192 RepID=A0A6J8D2D3_MYTCO|nr:unnamed protein product [Mytilus coruscus]
MALTDHHTIRHCTDHSSQQDSLLGQIIMEIPDELNALLAAMKLSGKEPAWKFSASTDQVTVQLIWNKAKEPEVPSGNSKPALKKKQNKPPSTRRRDAKRYDQWVQAKSSAATSAEVIPHTTKVDKNQQTEAKTALEGSREIIPTKYQGEPEGIVIKTDIVISPFNPRKACMPSPILSSANQRQRQAMPDRLRRGI